MASNFDEHLDKLEEVFKRLSQAGLMMKPSKCEFFKREILFLGHCVSQEGIKPNPKTVEAVRSWKVPTNVKETQSYLGLCSYYRQYIENFSHIASPLTNLTKKKVKIIWDDSCQEAYEMLKEKLCSAPILALPQPGLRYILDTDASDTGIGAVLSQIQEGRERVIASQLTKQRCINVGEAFYFGCENVLILRLGEFFRKVFLMFSQRFRSTLQKTFLQRCQSLYTTFL